MAGSVKTRQDARVLHGRSTLPMEQSSSLIEVQNDCVRNEIRSWLLAVVEAGYAINVVFC